MAPWRGSSSNADFVSKHTNYWGNNGTQVQDHFRRRARRDAAGRVARSTCRRSIATVRPGSSGCPNGADGWLVEGQPMLHNGQNIKGRGPVKFANASYFNEDGSPREGRRRRRSSGCMSKISTASTPRCSLRRCSSPASSSRSATRTSTCRSCRPTTPGWPSSTARSRPTG